MFNCSTLIPLKPHSRAGTSNSSRYCANSSRVFAQVPDQVIVNEYEPGQGITPHIDCEPCFGDTVASLTLGSGCVMDFTEVKGPGKASVWLERRSLVVLRDEARYEWRHSIAKSK